MKRNPQQSRQQILKAAEEVFAREGYEKASIRAIARRSKLNSALIYYYFKDKRGLYRTLLEESFGELRERLLKAFSRRAGAEEHLSTFIELYIGFLMEKRKLAQIMHRELSRDQSLVAALTHKYIAKNFALLTEFLDQGIKDGELRPLDVPLTPITLVGMMAFYFTAFPIISRLLAVEDYDEAFARRLIRHTKKLFFQGVLPQAKLKERGR